MKGIVYLQQLERAASSPAFLLRFAIIYIAFVFRGSTHVLCLLIRKMLSGRNTGLELLAEENGAVQGMQEIDELAINFAINILRRPGNIAGVGKWYSRKALAL